MNRWKSVVCQVVVDAGLETCEGGGVGGHAGVRRAASSCPCFPSLPRHARHMRQGRTSICLSLIFFFAFDATGNLR